MKYKEKYIQSLDNNIIKYIFKLKLKKYRYLYNQTIAEGLKVIDTILNSKWKLEYILYSDDGKDLLELIKHKIDKNNIIKVNKNIIDKISNLESNTGILAVFNFKNEDKNILLADKALVLDNIQDPGNMATIIRSALAFGFKDIVILNSVDIYSPKVIQASAGNVSLCNIYKIDLNQLIELTKTNNIKLISLVVKNGIKIDDINLGNSKIFLVIGNEGHGINQKLINNSDILYTINMDNNIESLNVSIAGSIALYIINQKLKNIIK